MSHVASKEEPKIVLKVAEIPEQGELRNSESPDPEESDKSGGEEEPMDEEEQQPEPPRTNMKLVMECVEVHKLN